ncbi:hypothetical protein ENSA5_60820 [Enhygromyxa salina]|uniref:Uncharacterized protein n=1 Tax=Enhygromyxa salina TaxID=215803 RepID=A0A2S9XDA2_9BACT|nr:hypothetical protein [Enhygromyxa salina]PRP90832.1 hypothetical protein ENSA5_60820 [Enhygromyxa salina]
MRIDGIAFASPDGLEDVTRYAYRPAESGPGRGDEELSVEAELPVGGATPAAEVIAELREALEGFFPGAFKLLGEGEATLAGAAGKFLAYCLDGGPGQATVVGKIVVANLGREGEPPGDWVKLAWSGSRDAGSLDAYVDPIVASFSAEADAPATVLPGHERRHAGPWALDVPAHLRGPRNFLWEDEEAELRVELSVLEAGADEPTIELGAAISGGEEVAREDSRLDEGERVDVRVRSDDDPHGESTLILAKRKIELGASDRGGHRWVVLSASAPSPEGPRLTTIVDALLASVRAEEEAR